MLVNALSQKRTHAQARDRGGWSHEASLKRYGKQARALAELNKVSEVVVQYGLQISIKLDHYFRLPCRTPLPPPRPPAFVLPSAKTKAKAKGPMRRPAAAEAAAVDPGRGSRAVRPRVF